MIFSESENIYLRSYEGLEKKRFPKISTPQANETQKWILKNDCDICLS